MAGMFINGLKATLGIILIIGANINSHKLILLYKV